MSETWDLRYKADFAIRRKDGHGGSHTRCSPVKEVPRIARLVALAIRLEGLIREQKVRDYAEAARLGKVTRARITQIMKLRNLAPDIQEQILFLGQASGINERNLRPIAWVLGWEQQRRQFQELKRSLPEWREAPSPGAVPAA